MEEKIKRTYRGSSWYDLLSINTGDKEELNEEIYRLIDEFAEFPSNSNMDVNLITRRIKDIFGELVETKGDKILLGGSVSERIKRVNEYYCRKPKPAETVALTVTRKNRAMRNAFINEANNLVSENPSLSRKDALKISAKKVRKPKEETIRRFIELLKTASNSRRTVDSDKLREIGFSCVTQLELNRCLKNLQTFGVNIILTFSSNGRKLVVKVESNIEENLKLLGELGKNLYNKTFNVNLNKKAPLPNNFVKVVERQNNTDTQNTNISTQNLSERVRNILFVVGSLIKGTGKPVSLVEVCTVLRESHFNLIESNRSIMEILKSYSGFEKSLDKSEERIGFKDFDDLTGFIEKLNPVNEEWIVPIYIGSGLSEEEILKFFPGSIRQGTNIWHVKANKGFDSFVKLAILYSKFRSGVDYIIEPKEELTNRLKLEVSRLLGAIQRHYIEGIMSAIDTKEINNQIINDLEKKY